MIKMQYNIFFLNGALHLQRIHDIQSLQPKEITKRSKFLSSDQRILVRSG